MAILFTLSNTSGKLHAQTVLASWDFPSNPDNATVDGGIPANAAAVLSTQGFTGNTTNYTTGGNVGSRSASTDKWDGGTGTKWWEINISTAGYYSCDLSSAQRSSNTGPRNFKVQYKVGAAGTWTDLDGATDIVCSATGFTAPGIITNIPLPSACDNQASVFIRWIMTSEEDAQNTTGNVSSAGTSRIDDIIVRGTTGTHYRSRQNGNWNGTTSWQTSADLVTWANTATPPTSANANTVTILSGHTITIVSNITVDQVIVANGGTLYYKSSTLTLADGSGIDLQVNGTFVDSSTTNVTWNGSATWAMGSAGTYIKMHNTNATNWQNKYQNGISKIPSTATWIIRKVSPTAPSLNSAGGMYYPNLIIESQNGTWGNAATNNFSATTAFPTILGNLDIGGTNSTQPVSFINDVSHATAIPVFGDVIVRSGHTLTIGGTANGATGFEFQKNLIVDGTINTSSAVAGLRKAIFSGSIAQTVSGAGSINFDGVEINKTANNVSLSNNININGTLTLTSGQIVSTATYMPRMAAGSTVSGGSTNSFVNGPLEKTGSTSFTFPIGNSTYYRPLSISALSGSDTFTAAYFPSDPTAASPTAFPSTSLAAGLDHVSDCEFWTLSETGTSTAKVGLSWGNPCNGVTVLANLRVASWDGTTWADLGNGATTGAISPATGTITSNLASTGFAALSLASSTGDNPLPITLLEFTGKPMPSGNLLNWTSSSEKNNDHFSIERAQDMHHFEVVGTVKGNGSTEALSHYTFTDKQPLSGINYYRLRQFDFDGSNEVSHVIAINANGASKTYTLINDLTNQQLLLRLEAPESNGEVTIIDLLGRKRLSQVLPAGQEEHGIACNQLEHGIYFLLIQRDGDTEVQKFFY